SRNSEPTWPRVDSTSAATTFPARITGSNFCLSTPPHATTSAHAAASTIERVRVVTLRSSYFDAQPVDDLRDASRLTREPDRAIVLVDRSDRPAQRHRRIVGRHVD